MKANRPAIFSLLIYGAKMARLFAPRSANAEEGDGWILGTSHHLHELCSKLVILYAQNMTECARMTLPFRTA